jgi:hypothetical protein
MVNFNAIQKYVPNDIYKMVSQDNHDYMFERQIFNASFFEAVRDMYHTLLVAAKDS